LVRALGLEKDVEINQLISEGDDFEEVYINLLEFQDIKTSEDAIRYLADKLKLTGSPEVKKEKLLSILDNLLLPNIGTSPNDRLLKAYNLLKMARKLLLLAHEKIDEDVKDHFANKIVRTPGELMREYF